MKILVLCNNDLASLFAVNLLQPALRGHQVLFGQSSQVGSTQNHPAAIQALIAHEKQIMSELNSEQAIQLFGKVLQTHPTQRIISFAELAEKASSPIYPMNQINSAEGIESVRQLEPELKLGVINLHSGLLPSYQGIMATFWAMLNGEGQIGCCLHYIQDKRIDAGDIIQQSPIDTNFKLSYLENLLGIYLPGIEIMANAVSQLLQGHSLVAQSQQGEPGYFGFPDEQTTNRFIELGYQLF
jgi:methionyl-tRNA formyltransferase